MSPAPRTATPPPDDFRTAEIVGSMFTVRDAQAAPAGRYLVKDRIDAGALSVLYGPPNVGKSVLALDLAIHVSAGVDWFGHRVWKEAGPALFL